MTSRTKKWRQRHPAKYLWWTMRGNAVQRRLECTITLEEVETLLRPMTCALTGWSLRWDADAVRDPLAPSPDRIDNAVGYISGNVRIVAWRINDMRGDLTDAQFLDACRSVARSSL